MTTDSVYVLMEGDLGTGSKGFQMYFSNNAQQEVAVLWH